METFSLEAQVKIFGAGPIVERFIESQARDVQDELGRRSCGPSSRAELSYLRAADSTRRHSASRSRCSSQASAMRSIWP